MFFANEQRENVRDENPGITFGMPSLNTSIPLPLLILDDRPGWQGPR